jgi:hypothetical protein
MARSSDRDGRPSHARGFAFPVSTPGVYSRSSRRAVDTQLGMRRGILRFPEVIARRCVKCIGGAWVAASYFEIVIGIPTFSIRPMVVWNNMLRIRKVVRSHTVSFTE